MIIWNVWQKYFYPVHVLIPSAPFSWLRVEIPHMKII
jgi:hypothetical protein